MDPFNYIGDFEDIIGNKYAIQITNGNEVYTEGPEDRTDLVFGGTPALIETSSDDFFGPIKSRSLTVQIVTKKFMKDFYAAAPQDVKVRVWKTAPSLSVIFNGYVTPNSYNMDYTYLDTFELECVDAISTLKDIDYQPITTNSKEVYQVIYIIWKLLKRAGVGVTGYGGYLYVMDDITAIDGTSGSIDDIYISEANFFDDDDEKTPWKCYEVLEEILRYLGLTLQIYNNNIYLIDYRKLHNNRTNINIKRCSINSNSMIWTNTTLTGQLKNISLENYVGGTSQLNLEEVYNKITVSTNTYDIDDLIEDPTDEKNLICINLERNEYDIVTNGIDWSFKYTTFLWVKKTDYTTVPAHYTVYYRINEDTTHWKHHFYKITPWQHPNPINPTTPINRGAYGASGAAPEIQNTGANAGMNYYDPNAPHFPGSEMKNAANKFFNTFGVLPFKYSFDIDKESVTWNNALYFQLFDDTSTNIDYNFIKNRETYPVLEYESDEEIILKPGVGTTWITINGDLWYQRNQTVSATTVRVTSVGNVYTAAPLDTDIVVYNNKGKEVTFEKEQFHNSLLFTNPNDDTDYSFLCRRLPFGFLYDTGFDLWKMKVQVGDKYWTQTRDINNTETWWGQGEWTTEESTFNIYFNNEPDPESDSEVERNENVTNFKWMTLKPNCVETDIDGLKEYPVINEYIRKTGDHCYAIPIYSKDENAPLKGKLKITIYPPKILPDDFASIDESKVVNTNFNAIGTGVYLKNFKIEVAYTDENVWWLEGDNKDSDIVYTNTSDTDGNSLGYVNEYEITLRVNSTSNSKPISKSYVSKQNGLINYITNSCGSGQAQTQELNLIEKYYEHYNKPAMKYTFNTYEYFAPTSSFTFTADELNGYFYVDTQSWNLQRANNTITATQYVSSL